MKAEIRKVNKQRRALMTVEEVAQKSHKASEKFLASDIYKKASVVMLYMPLGNETDTAEILKSALNDGKKVVFPVTDASSGEISPYYADESTVFEKGAFCVNEPRGGRIAVLEEIDVIVVPGVAFDRKGQRVGFGKGCYDRFLQKLRAVKVGFCYDFQLCDIITGEEHDINMDCLVTEKGMFRCK